MLKKYGNLNSYFSLNCGIFDSVHDAKNDTFGNSQFYPDFKVSENGYFLWDRENEYIFLELYVKELRKMPFFVSRTVPQGRQISHISYKMMIHRCHF